MSKVIVMVRTSTDVQSIEDQHREMEEFCVSEGWDKGDIVWVEEQGASAAKVDDAYRAMIDRVKEEVDRDRDIKCFAVWHLNRLARTEEVWIEVKSFFVKRQVQIICKNPYLKLLTPDGKVDPGMELAMGLMAILSKQDQEERKAKFKRAKTAMLKKGMYIGGNVRKYGYKIEGKAFTEDEQEGRIVRLVFELYSTGKYSAYTLSKELQERGIRIDDRQIVRILASDAYIGVEVGKHGLKYPQIISKETWEKCEAIRSRNKLMSRDGKRLILCSKLVKCHVCGATCTPNTRHYVCSKHMHHGPCDNGFALKIDVVDDLAWRIAFTCHMDYLLSLDSKKKKEYKKELKIVEQKIAAAERKMDDFTKKKERIVESFLDLVIDKKTRDLRLSKLSDEVRLHMEQESVLKARKMALERMLQDHSEDAVSVVMDAVKVMDSESKYSVIHRHIEKVVGIPISYGARDKRTHRPNAVEITVSSVYGQDYKFLYFPKFYQHHNLYVWNGREWRPDYVTKV